MAQKTTQINEATTEEKASNTSFWKFAKSEASRFYLDENKNVNIIVYKQAKFTIEGANDCESEEFVNNVREIKRGIIKLIKMFRILDADLIMIDVDDFEIINSGKVLLMTYLFPAIDGVNKVLESFYSFCKSLQYGFKVAVKVTDICKITYDNRTLDESDVFIRGYVAGSYFPAIEGKNGITKLQKTYLRSDCGIAKSVGFDISDLKKFNTYNSAFNRVRLFKGGDGGKEVSTLIPFRGKISIVTYKANACVSNGILNFIRNVYDISYTYVKDKDKKSITSYGPRGIRVTSYTDEVETGDFIDLFYKDGVNLVTTSFLGANESEYPEWSVFMNEANQFSRCFLDSFEPSKDEPVVETKSSENTKNAANVEVVSEEVSTTEEPVVEEPKKSSKKKTSKKAKTEEVTEEVSATEEPVAEAE